MSTHTTKPRNEGLSVTTGHFAEVQRSCVLGCGAMLYGFEAWIWYAVDVRCSGVFDHRYLRSIAKTEWGNHMLNDSVRNIVLGEYLIITYPA